MSSPLRLLRLPVIALATAGFFLFTAHSVFAVEPDHHLKVQWDSTNNLFHLTWPSVVGRTYFIKHSDDLLTPWNWMPIIETGNGTVKEWAFAPTGEKGFWQLAYSDIPTSNPETADFDSDGVPNLFEVQNGFSPLGTTDENGNGLPDEWELYFAGKFAIWPPALSASMPVLQTETRSIYLRNDTDTPVDFSVALSNNLVPAYRYEDSLTGSASYAWEDISTTGQLLSNISSVDDAYQAVTFTGFTFPFFGTSYTSVFVSSNGLLAFGQGQSAYGNTSLPSASAPANIIAPFWDDLNTATGGDVFFKQETDRAIIQFQDVAPYSGSGNYTFQTVLYADGRIQFRYKTLTGPLNSCTVGIQDSTKTSGFNVAYNTAYLVNGLAVNINPQSSFIKVTPDGGTVPARTTLPLEAKFNSFQLSPGNYTATVTTSHNAAQVAGPHIVSATMEVLNSPSEVALIYPTDGISVLQNADLNLVANASDLQGIERVEFYAGAVKIGEALDSPYTFTWHTSPAGATQLTARVIDRVGATTNSSAIAITVIADSDADGMADAWEMAQFGDLSHTASDDADHDGYTNIEEYQLGHNPLVAEDTDGDGMPDGWEDHHGTNKLINDANEDPDFDGLTNLGEFQNGTEPWNPDYDGDGLLDGYEVQYASLDPKVFNQPDEDNDHDGMGVRFEAIYGFNPEVNDGGGDADGDGLTNAQEYAFGSDPLLADADSDGLNDAQEQAHGTDPYLWDTDGDGLPDGYEVAVGLNPLVFNAPGHDTDGDGLSDVDEFKNGTNPLLPDTDGDGVGDAVEVQSGADPTDPSDGGQAPPPENKFKVAFQIASQGKNVTASCAKCHHFDVQIGSKTAATGETVELVRGRSYEVKLKDKPQIWRPAGQQLPHENTAKYTLWPQSVDGQAITAMDDDKVLIAQRGEVLDYVIQNNQKLLAQNKDWQESFLQKTATLTSVQIEEVNFGGGKYWELKSDSSSDTYAAPQWKDANGDGDASDAGEKNYAVAFTQNTKPTVGGKFKIPDAANLGTIKLKASGPDGILVPETVATVSGNEISMSLTETTTALPSTVKFYDKSIDAKAFKLEWEIKVGSSGWTKIGTTKHTVYVTKSDPTTSRREESLFYIGCKEANGKIDNTEIISSVWSLFANRNVNRVDGEQLAFYRVYNTLNISTESLLKDADGQCTAWAKLLVDVLRIQGIGGASIVEVKAEFDPGFLVENWSFVGTGIGPNTIYPYVNLHGSPVTTFPFIVWDDNLFDDVAYQWRYTQVVDGTGIAGQGRNNPASIFSLHYVVLLNGQYYDPSYGLVHTSPQSFSDKVAGFTVIAPNEFNLNETTVGIDLNYDGDTTDLNENSGPALFMRKKVSASEMIFGDTLSY